MGTRHLTCVVLEGKFVVAQYGQWDGYPSGQGITALNFVRTMDREKFVQNLRKCRFISKEEFDDMYHSLGIDPTKEWITVEEGDRFGKAFPQLSRDTGAEVLEFIEKSTAEEILLKDSIVFAADGVFCEYAWVVDLDQNVFEMYEGFGETPLVDGERFKYLEGKSRAGYYPVHLCFTFELNALPSDKEFLKITEKRDEDEEDAEEKPVSVRVIDPTFEEQLQTATQFLFVAKDLTRDDVFVGTGRVHDWRNYVPTIIQDRWVALTLKERALVALTADMAADREEWD